MLYNKLKIGMQVYDADTVVYGIVDELDDIHNVYIKFDDYGGGGLYCLDPSCDEYDGECLKIIE